MRCSLRAQRTAGIVVEGAVVTVIVNDYEKWL